MHLDPECDRLVRPVAGGEAAALVDAGVLVLDVRTPEEFTGLGHIPGAKLLPVHLAASAPAMLADPDSPVLVCCEHAVRSRFAARLLVQTGFTRVYELAGGMARWGGDRAFEPQPVFGPSAWLVDNVDLLPPGGHALDVASGRGRHALLLAAAGFEVTAIDRDPQAIAGLRRLADRLGLDIRAEARDLEEEEAELERGAYDLVVVTRYLHRPLFPRLVASLAPGGTLVYETFLEAQAARGRPTNPAFLLKPGELAALVRPLAVLRQREGEFDGAMLAGVVARAAGA